MKGGGSYKVLDGTRVGPEHNRGSIVGSLPLGLCVDSTEVEFFPHQFQKLVDIPTMLRTNGNGVGDSVQEIKLLDSDGVNLVQSVNDRYISATFSLEDIDQIINRRVASDGDIGRRDLIFAHDSFDFLLRSVPAITYV